ncbi:hypothetical protein ACRQ5Q_42860 (plasmid) [Bradyrhizobium sp. PMVTL-01]|uniref:hypothetical protein n=1 Tax=Bradyrhizobium sp. PMVTL-01 TaxID=3434999 RepID=UPI003F71A90D
MRLSLGDELRQLPSLMLRRDPLAQQLPFALWKDILMTAAGFCGADRERFVAVENIRLLV